MTDTQREKKQTQHYQTTLKKLNKVYDEFQGTIIDIGHLDMLDTQREHLLKCATVISSKFTTQVRAQKKYHADMKKYGGLP